MLLTFFASSLAFNAPGGLRPPQPPQHAAAAVRSPASGPRMDSLHENTVPLTGETLKAALKMRCDLTDAAYAIYWSQVRDKMVDTGEYVCAKNGLTANFVEGSRGVTLDANGNGPVAQVKRTGQPYFVPDVEDSNLKRKELAYKCGITQVVMIPFEDGVLEYGNTNDRPQWDTVPLPPVIPKAPLRKAFEDLGALYAIYWDSDGETMRVTADYENPREKARRQTLRSGSESFVGTSRALTLDATGSGPVAEALNAGEERMVYFYDGCEAEQCSSMKRAGVAREFGISSIHFVPVIDADGAKRGVLEYGVSSAAQMNEETAEATLQMQADGAGAGYAIYWKQVGAKALNVKTYTSLEYRGELERAGLAFSFAEASEATTFDVAGDSAVATVLRTHEPLFLQRATDDADDDRDSGTYLVRSSAFVPTLGGVIEFGTTAARDVWRQSEDALKQTIPNEEVEKAFEKGASYTIFWQRNNAAGTYEAAASFELAKNTLNKEDLAKSDSFVKGSAASQLAIDGVGPVAVCGRSNAVYTVADTQDDPSFKRKELAKEWGVGKITCVPLETGVLEFGTVTKDKRETTFGSEYQEATRAYRRTVFMHKEWEYHRSSDRFFRSLATIVESGVLRARNGELGGVASVATFIVLWNIIASGYTDFEMVKHPALIEHVPTLSIPLSIFSITAPSLGLLLNYRTTAAYERWDNARKVWGDIINKCRSFVRQSNTFFEDDRYPGYGNFRDYRRRAAAETSAFTRCLRCFLRGKEDEENLRVELKGLGFSPEEVAGYMGAANKQVYALQMMAQTMRMYGMDGRDRVRMDDTLSALCDDVGACERIFKTPIPLVYTRHTSRFVGSWLALLPLAIWGVDASWNHLVTVPSCALIVFFLLGIEELGLQIEEPFGILPMEAFCDGAIGAALNEMVLAEDVKRAEEERLSLVPPNIAILDEDMTGTVVPTSFAELQAQANK